MDLRNIMNDSAGAAPIESKERAQSTPTHARQSSLSYPNHPAEHHDQWHAEYAQRSHGSQGAHRPQDARAQYPQPSYSNAPSQSPYGQPPPHPSPYGDPRSPGANNIPPSPYQQQSSNGYPFPPPQRVPASPTSQPRYGQPPPGAPPTQGYARSDSFPRPLTASPGPPPPFAQPQNTMPQTPPVTGHQSSLQHHIQRSHSTHSGSTPTSAHSQHAPGPIFASPVTASRPSPYPQARQGSQPPTPLGPPSQPSAKQSQGQPTFAHPASPYQQRTPSSTGAYPAYPSHLPSPRQVQPPLAQPQRAGSTTSAHDMQIRSGYSQRPSLTVSERERSLSVSPKTRVPSIPSSAGHRSSFSGTVGDHEAQYSSAGLQSLPEKSPLTPTVNGQTMASNKRKFDERGLEAADIERQQPRGVDGNVKPPPFQGAQSLPHEAQIAQPHPKRRRHRAPPIWAQRYDDHTPLRNANFTLRHPKVHKPLANGKAPLARPQRPPPTDVARVNGDHADARPREPVPVPPQHETILGAWESTIAGELPLNQMSQIVADFLFLNVVSNHHVADLRQQGGEVEIEAKLGTLIDRNIDDRVNFPIQSECIVGDVGHISFKSSMTEIQHKHYNEYLNHETMRSAPQNQHHNPKPRVAIEYKHRREVDRFYELPGPLRNRLPDFAQQLLAQKRFPPRVRVTTDMKTGAELAKIVKVNVGNIDLFLPACGLDCRISVNIECKWDGTVEELEAMGATAVRGGQSPPRQKDRMSYKQTYYHVDLTQVRKETPGPNHTTIQELEHELEIEVDAEALRDQGQRALRGEDNGYLKLVEGLVNNVRLLAGKANDFAQPRPGP